MCPHCLAVAIVSLAWVPFYWRQLTTYLASLMCRYMGHDVATTDGHTACNRCGVCWYGHHKGES